MTRTDRKPSRSFSSRLAATGLAAAAVAGVMLASASASAADGFVLDPEPNGPTTIVGGQENTGDPSVPLLVVHGAQGEQSICTGSLVGAQWILTAAHCVDTASLGFEPAQIEVYFGTQYSEQDPGYLGSVMADSFTFHERWNTNDLEAGYDIGMIHLSQPVDLPLIPLLARPLAFEEVGSQIRLIGWGLTYGDRQDSGVKRHVTSTMFDFNELLVLVGDQNANTCSGDSGGPAVMNIGGQEVQIGVTSFGDQMCAETGVDTRVDVFADWIQQTTGGEVVPGVTTGGGGGTPGPQQPPQPGPDAPQQPGGAGCQTHDDCGGGLCVSDGNQSLCTTTCTSGADCGAGMDCFATEDDPNVGVCWPSEDPGTVDPDDDGGDKGIGGGGAGGGGRDRDGEDDGLGCSVAPSRKSPAGLLSLLGLGLLGLARRRRQ